MRRLWYRLIQLAMVLLAAFIVWAGCYVYYHGFGKKWRKFVTTEFRKRGIALTMRRLTLDPFRGVVAREVKITDPKDQDKVLAFVDQVVLDINYANLLHGEPFLNAVALTDASVALPLDPAQKSGPRLKIAGINAYVLLPPHQILVSRLEADLYGVHISANGRLNHPYDFKLKPPKPGSSQILQRAVSSAIDELENLRFDGGAPRIDVKFSGDLDDAAAIFATGTVWAPGVTRNGYRMQNIYATVTWNEGLVTLSRLTASDSRGALDASGAFVPETSRLDLQLHSTLDMQKLGKSLKLTDALNDFVFYGAPSIDLEGHAELKGDLKFALIGRADIGKFAYKSVIFDRLGAGFSWDQERWYVRDVELIHHSGSLTASALQRPGDFRAEVLSKVDPRAFLPLTSGKTSELLGQLVCLQPPRVQLDIRGSAPSFDHCVATGTLDLGQTEMRGVPIKRASAQLRVAERAITYRNLHVDRDEGTGSGTFTYDFARHEVRLEGIKTLLKPQDVGMWIDPRLAHDLEPYRFKSAPQLAINGVVQTSGGKETRLEVGVNAPGGMDYVFLKKNLSFPAISGRLLFTDGLLHMSNVTARLYGGEVSGGADISLKKNAPGFTARLSAENVDFASLTKLYFHYDTAQGALGGHFDFGGTGKPETLEGRGSVKVTDGDVFAIPVLGPFSGILNSVVPGMGYNVARQASASFDVREGVISTKDFLVQGKGFDMIGEGKLFYLEDKIDFNIRINAQGLPGVLLFPVSKLLEYTTSSSLSKPVWKPKRLPAL